MKSLLLKSAGFYRRNGFKVTFRRAISLLSRDRTFTFSEIYRNNHWGNSESRSGLGSSVLSTQEIRARLPVILSQWNLKEIIDAPCGDFNWMKLVALSPDMHYLGVDIVPDVISENIEKYADDQHRFLLADLTKDILPKGDIVICRDCLFHLSNKDIARFLKNFVASGTPWLLTTTNKNTDEFRNTDILTGQYRAIDLFAPPFSFPRDVAYRFNDSIPPDPPKEMCLWSRDQIIKALAA